MENQELALGRRLIWKQKFKEEVCVRIFGAKECATAELELKLYQEGTKFTLVVRLGSLATFTYGLKLGCVSESKGPLSFEVCVKDFKIENGKLVSIRLTAELCIGIKLLGIKIEECWDVLDATIQLFTLNSFRTLQEPSILEESVIEAMEEHNSEEIYVQIDNKHLK